MRQVTEWFEKKPIMAASAFLAMFALIVLIITGCAGLQFKIGQVQKLAMAKEGGYQVTFRLMSAAEKRDDIAPADLKALKDPLVKQFKGLLADLKDPSLIVNAEFIKQKVYDWTDETLAFMKDAWGVTIPPEDLRLILKTRDMFALEGGREATPEERVLGQAFCDGVLEALE